LSKPLQDLRTAILAHGVASWQAMESGMSRRESNATAYRRNGDSLVWTVAWRLPAHRPADQSTLSASPVPENTTLIDALRAVVALPDNVQLLGDVAVTDCAFLLRVEGSPANAPSYFLLAPEESLRSALTGVNIIEYPTIAVISRTALAEFTVVPKPPPKPTSLVVVVEPDQS
jgi:hypothetical protein